MRLNHLVAAAALGTIALAACGSGSYSSGSAKPKPATPVATAMSEPPAVGNGMSSLGAVLVDAKGLTLYGLTNDSSGTPTCVGVCANVWPWNCFQWCESAERFWIAQGSCRSSTASPVPR